MDPVTERVPLRATQGSIVPHILLVLVQIAALSAPPKFPHRRELTISAIVALCAVCHTSPFTQDFGTANLFALAWPHYLLTLSHFAFAILPEETLWRRDRPPREAAVYPAFSWRKIRWSLALLVNLRGVGWSYEVAHLPQRVKHPSMAEGKVRFLLLQLIDLAWMVTMGDLVSHLGQKLFFTDPETGLRFMDSKSISVWGGGALWSLARTFVYGAGPYFFINMQYVACSIGSVLLGLTQPMDWPPLFGPLAKAVTVRSFWNSFWHQMIRNALSSFSRRFAHSLGLKSGSTLYSYTHLWTAFFISGVMHAGSMVILPSPLNISLKERTFGVVCFFVWQAAMITLEDFMIWIFPWPKTGIWISVVGYIWVVCSFWVSLPMAGDVMLRLRMGEDTPFPSSMFQTLIHRIPIVTG